MSQYGEDLAKAMRELFSVAGFKSGQIIVIGCSTSEVLGKHIGKGSSKELGEELFSVINKLCLEQDLKPAFQCCEHLNRALVVNRGTADKYSLPEVSVVPVPGAGGSMAAAAFQGLVDPVVVESIQAHGGIDIGDTFIGMHLRPVAVPVRLSLDRIGQAHLTVARTRPKLIGGERAVYQVADASLTCF
ncbi:MAG: TIGR01440 family protein [Peptococcaceae bacterium]|nr:TIGR01440 family protein [Peptococcaceae bacterium]